MSQNNQPQPSQGDWFFSDMGGEIISMPMQTKICSRVSGESYEEGKANGRLMAASKELQNVAIACYNFLLSDGDMSQTDTLFQQCKDALLKSGHPIIEQAQSDDWDNLPF